MKAYVFDPILLMNLYIATLYFYVTDEENISLIYTFSSAMSIVVQRTSGFSLVIRR